MASSVGGRNQHFALYAATRLQASDGPIAVLSAGTDGIDGNSPFAGAVVDGRTLEDPRLRSEALLALIGVSRYLGTGTGGRDDPHGAHRQQSSRPSPVARRVGLRP